MTKFVFVTGGVVSSLGKGIAAASLAAILASRGVRVTNLKLDPYINVDPGTMSPFQHGEVFVTASTRPALVDLYGEFATLAWTRESIGAAVKSAAARHGLKAPPLMMALRMLVTGTPQTPAIDAVLALVGRDATRERMRAGLSL